MTVIVRYIKHPNENIIFCAAFAKFFVENV